MPASAANISRLALVADQGEGTATVTHAHDNDRGSNEGEGASGDVQRGADRRSAWNDPRFVVPLLMSFFMAVISTVVSVTIIVNSQRSDISNVKEQIAELRGQVVALQSLATTTTEQKGQISAVLDRMAKLENAVNIQQASYNFNFTSRLVAVEVRAGIKPQNSQPAQP